MTKQLYVSSAVQAALLKQVLIPQMSDGFWKNHRPADHASQWKDVEIIVSETDKLGAENFVIPRLYNFVNPDFIKPNEQLLVSCAQSVKASSNFRSVKKELIELSRIVGGRLNDKNGIPSKANRGNNKPGSNIVEAVKTAKATVKKADGEVKRTAVKRVEGDVTVTTTANGATVTRVPVTRAVSVSE